MSRSQEVRRLVAVVLVLSVSCVGGSLSISQRFAAVHNAVAPAGWAQLGPVSEGELAEDQSARIDLQLSGGRCYIVSAIGGPGVRDLAVALLDRDGAALASESARSPQGSIHACPDRGGAHSVHVTMAAGAGDFAVFTWAPAGEAGAMFAAGGGGGGTCDEPLSLRPGAGARGTTQDAADEMAPACISPGGSSAPERVYRFEVEVRGSFEATLSARYDGVLSLLAGCPGGEHETLACNDDADRGDATRSRIRAILEPGVYYLVVDGYGRESGAYSLSTQFRPMRPLAEVCADLPALEPGVETTGTTTGRTDDFQTSEDCAAGSRAPDTAFRLAIERPSRVRLRLDADYDGVVSIRSDCAAQSSVVACNDDFGEGEESRRSSQVVARLEPGTYTVIVDGYEGEHGTFRLLATVAPEGESSAPGDACGGAVTLAADEEASADTFLAADDLRGSCASEPGGADVVYRIDLPARSLVTAEAGGDLPDTVLYIQRTCGDRASEAACGTRSLSAVLGPGAYYLVVDGARRDALGRVTVRWNRTDVSGLEAFCSDAASLESGREVRGRTSGEGRFEATCGERARNPEVVYSLRVRQRSQVRIDVEAEFDSVLYVRRDCVDPGTVVDCNDDAGDERHSALDLTLDPGTYYVFVDGYGVGGQSGSFKIKAEVTPR
ncbi:MAG: hypothetical protein QME96_00370 [Myxococcota bacterium]|nr:hypothetical protein [Myxococcota bacterium]